ncbi:MAG: hypothetical protein NC200_04540 [Candidatus Gastranaerophilales bacterium]|nr:hypothetical protein [Candidatus Gastranaerophilales bacterium]
MYHKHVKEMLKLRNTDKEAAKEHAGRAIHYLQDISQPQHIEKGNVLQKAIERPAHKKFEQYSCERRHHLIRQAHKSNEQIYATSFSQLFNNTLSISSEMEVPTMKNKSNWSNIAQQGYNIALSATKKFIEMFDKILS